MIVTDCSVLVDALVGPDPAPVAARLVDERLAAPALVDFEFLSALRGLTLGGQLSEHRAQDALSDFEQLPIQRWAMPEELRRRVFELRHAVSAYDAAYVVLADVLDCPLMTRDGRLAKAAQRHVEVIVA